MPSPRTSFALATHKKRAVIFGGVTDQHGKGDQMFSTLHDDLYQFNFDSRRWYPVAVKAPAKALNTAGQAADASQLSHDTQQSNSATGGQAATDGGAAATAQQATQQVAQHAQQAPQQVAQRAQQAPQQAAQPKNSSAAASSGSSQQVGSQQRDVSDARGSPAGGNGEDGVTVQPDLADKLSRAGVDKESALYKAAARIQSRFRGYTVRKVSCCTFKLSAYAPVEAAMR